MADRLAKRRERRGRNQLTAAYLSSNVGDGVMNVAFIVLAKDIDPTSQFVGLIVALRFLPHLFLSMPAGVITDRLGAQPTLLVIGLFRVVLFRGRIGLPMI